MHPATSSSAGTITPGNSPGRIRINCNLISLPGSNLVLDIAFNGTSYDFDELIIGSGSTFDLTRCTSSSTSSATRTPRRSRRQVCWIWKCSRRAGNANDETDFSDTNNLGLSSLFSGDEKWSDVI